MYGDASCGSFAVSCSPPDGFLCVHTFVGYISKAELLKTMDSLGMLKGPSTANKAHEVSSIMKAADADSDGRLSYKEFKQLYPQLFPPGDSIHVREAFMRFDSDCDGACPKVWAAYPVKMRRLIGRSMS